MTGLEITVTVFIVIAVLAIMGGAEDASEDDWGGYP